MLLDVLKKKSKSELKRKEHKLETKTEHQLRKKITKFLEQQYDVFFFFSLAAEVTEKKMRESRSPHSYT